jgi:hypothetical protein
MDEGEEKTSPPFLRPAHVQMSNDDIYSYIIILVGNLLHVFKSTPLCYTVYCISKGMKTINTANTESASVYILKYYIFFADY